MTLISWQFKKKGEWKNFLPEANAIIEKANAESKKEVRFKAFGNKYKLNFKKKKVKIEGSKHEWTIRKTGSSDIQSASIQSAFDKIEKTRDTKDMKEAVKNFMPPHHLLYQTGAASGHVAPIILPKANIGIAGKILLTVIRGRRLFNTQNLGQQSPYIRFSMEGISKKKKVVYPVPKCRDGGMHPLWNHTVEIPVSSEDRYLRMSVWNKNVIADSLIGRCRLPLRSILPFCNPIVAFYKEKTRQSYATMFLCTKKYHKDCAKYSLRSWFQLVRDFGSTHVAGQLLLEFRFFPYRASKILSWESIDTGTLKKRHGEIKRTIKIFGSSLSETIAASESKLPQPVFDCVEFLSEFAVDHEGLFRIPGDAKKVEEFKNMYDTRGKVSLKGNNEVAGLLKLFFRELPEPLIPYTHYRGFISVPGSSSSTQDLVEKFKVVIATMDINIRNILRYLITFLSEIAKQSDVNKMLPKNLAVCWAPSLMKSDKPNDPSTIVDIPKTIAATEGLIKNAEKIFGVARIQDPVEKEDKYDIKTLDRLANREARRIERLASEAPRYNPGEPQLTPDPSDSSLRDINSAVNRDTLDSELDVVKEDEEIEDDQSEDEEDVKEGVDKEDTAEPVEIEKGALKEVKEDTSSLVAENVGKDKKHDISLDQSPKKASPVSSKKRFSHPILTTVDIVNSRNKLKTRQTSRTVISDMRGEVALPKRPEGKRSSNTRPKPPRPTTAKRRPPPPPPKRKESSSSQLTTPNSPPSQSKDSTSNIKESATQEAPPVSEEAK
eukprot:CAMPEP_0167754398 /NCGR_PEP_ID=MMETSP0110_2-20121227/8245_1 /TAXON_ID=629695 /ORGANISM="Gymnochlora sp., Strain CCMP2014" /LENGTH=774 /DNA_ID=CAMNT_0007640267 /DNA_START=148 /DNA_END=2472 /DNA_ORIENTATION=-